MCDQIERVFCYRHAFEFWIGLTSPGHDCEGKLEDTSECARQNWTWADGTAYNDWHKKQWCRAAPLADTYCATIYFLQHADYTCWRGDLCTYERPFICERGKKHLLKLVYTPVTLGLKT